jgi:hypothetical protein
MSIRPANISTHVAVVSGRPERKTARFRGCLRHLEHVNPLQFHANVKAIAFGVPGVVARIVRFETVDLNARVHIALLILRKRAKRVASTPPDPWVPGVWRRGQRPLRLQGGTK